MAQTIKHYDRAQNIYASGVTDTNAANAIEAGKAAGLEVMCEVKVVPTDIFGNILEKAKGYNQLGFGEDCRRLRQHC